MEHGRRIWSKAKPNRRDIEDLTAKERMSMMWLSLDGVIEILPISRASIWRMVEEGRFPAPYDVRGTAMWPEKDIQQWIRERIAEEPNEGLDYKPATWDGVLGVLRDGKLRTSREVAKKLGSNVGDTRILIGLMYKAGAVDRAVADPLDKRCYHYRIKE